MKKVATPKESVKNDYSSPLDVEPKNIIEAMTIIIDNVRRLGLNPTLYSYLEKPIHYLSERLQLSEVQAVLMSVITEIGSNDLFSLSDISNYFCCTNLEAVTLVKDIEELSKRRLIEVERSTQSGGNFYKLPWGAIAAYSNNDVYVPKTQQCEDTEEFLMVADSISFYGEFGSPSSRDFQFKLAALLRDNAHLDFVKKLNAYKFDLNDSIIIIYSCALLFTNGISEFGESDFFNMADRRYLHKAWKELRAGTNKFNDLGFVEPVCDNGMEDQKCFTLTAKAKEEFLSGVNIKEKKQNKGIKGFVQPADIMPKAMFYNDTEKSQLKRLESLLMQDNYLEICKRLKDNGMRTGFACLFYGAPGTGKTETVMQLARATERSIFQVNMAGIRDKWVGESEKNVKAIFSQYKTSVKASMVAPILLLNEADALLGGRFTDVNHSVERMENTIQNIILEEMEKLNGILIATTNLTCNLDSAFERRFLFKVEFHAPEATVRKDIWRTMIPQLTDDDALKLASCYNFSGGQIENIARKSQIECILEGTTPSFDTLRTFCDEECLAKRKAPTAIIGFRNK